jgi:hypothetical protein
MWSGHLLAIADGRYLLDPTITQVERGRCPPLVVELPPWWIEGGKPMFPDIPGTVNAMVRYIAMPGRGGYQRARISACGCGECARPRQLDIWPSSRSSCPQRRWPFWQGAGGRARFVVISHPPPARAAKVVPIVHALFWSAHSRPQFAHRYVR